MKKIFTHSEANEVFKFRCQLKWSELYGKSPADTVRYCDDCQHNVYLCENKTELLEHAKQGHCVAIATEVLLNERLTYRISKPENMTMGIPSIQDESVAFLEREDGLKLRLFPVFFYVEEHERQWHSNNELLKNTLGTIEPHASCRNQDYIYQLKELLAWVDEAIAAGLKWRYTTIQ